MRRLSRRLAILAVSHRSARTSAASLMTPARSCAVAGCKWGLSTPSAGITTLKTTRYGAAVQVGARVNTVSAGWLKIETSQYPWRRVHPSARRDHVCGFKTVGVNLPADLQLIGQRSCNLSTYTVAEVMLGGAGSLGGEIPPETGWTQNKGSC